MELFIHQFDIVFMFNLRFYESTAKMGHKIYCYLQNK